MKRYIFYFLSLFFIITFLFSLIYTYKVYFQNETIKVSFVSDFLNDNIKENLNNKFKDFNFKILNSKSQLEIDKLPSILKLTIYDIVILDNNNKSQSILDKLSINLTLKDVLNTFTKSNKLYLSSINLSNIHLNGTLSQNKFIPGPMLSLIIANISDKENNSILKLNRNKIFFDKVNFTLNNKDNIFKNKKIKIACDKIEINDAFLNLNCSDFKNIDFSLNVSALNDSIELKGFLKNLNLKIFNKKIFRGFDPEGFISARYNISVFKNFHLNKVNLDFKSKTNVYFKNNKKFILNGNIHWNQLSKKLDFNNFMFNNNVINGSTKISENQLKVNAKINVSNIKISELKTYSQKFLGSKDLSFNSEILNNISFLDVVGTLKNNIVEISLTNDFKKNVFKNINIVSKGTSEISKIRCKTTKSQNIDSSFFGNYNLIFNDKSPKIILNGFFKDTKLISNERILKFKRIELDVSLNEKLIEIKKLYLKNKKSELIDISGNVEIDKDGIMPNELSIQFFKIPFLSLKDIYLELNDNSISNELHVNGGLLEKGKIYFKNININKNKKDYKILGELNFKNLVLNSSYFTDEIKLKELQANFNNLSDVFGKLNFDILDIPVSLSYNLKNNENFEGLGHINPNKNLLKILEDNFNIEINSLQKTDFRFSGNIFSGNFYIDVLTDLTNSSIRNKYINLNKSKNIKSNFSTTLNFKNFKLISLENFNFTYGKKNFNCFVNFPKKNVVKISELVSHNSKVKTLTVEKIGQNIKLKIFGEKIDLSFLRENNIPDKNNNKFSIDFDITGEKILIDKKILLSGNYRGIYSNDVISSLAIGKMYLNDQSIMDQGEFIISLKNKNYSLSGQGYLGGSPIKVEIFGSDKLKPKIIFESDNGGSLLSSLGFTEKIKSGKLFMEIEFLDDELKTLSGYISSENFSVKDAPGIVKALSSLSFAGINSIFIGQGVGFKNGSAQFLKKDDHYQFDKILINNDILNIFLRGKYNFKKNDVNFVGSIAPMKAISRLLSVVPAVSELLTGLDKEGIVAGQFKLFGDLESPSLNINEGSFAPGVLRNIFSRDWLKKK